MSESIADVLADLIARLDGRAAGLWVRAGESLRLVAFQPAPDLPDAVRDGFSEATRAVPLSSPDLSIVQAFVGKRPVLAVTETLPPETGSGRWLRAFGASCSLAVPVSGSDPHTTGVLSVAMRAVPSVPDEVAALLCLRGTGLLPAAPRDV